MRYTHQILKRDMKMVVDLVADNFSRRFGKSETRLSVLNKSIYAALEDWLEYPCRFSYTADLRFLILVHVYRKFHGQLVAHEFVPSWNLALLGDVLGELIEIKKRWLDGIESRSKVRDANGNAVNKTLVQDAFTSLSQNNWSTFDDWRKNGLYAFAVVSVSK